MMKIKAVSLVVFALLSATTFGQKVKVTDAALAYKNYQMAFMKQDLATCKDELLRGKAAIDEAAMNAETKDDTKTHYYRGVIYAGLMELSALPGNDDLKDFQSEETLNIVKTNLKSAYETPKSKYKSQAEEFVGQRSNQTYTMATAMYESGKYQEAFQGFYASYFYLSLIGKEDEAIKGNASICANKAVNDLMDAGQLDEANSFAEEVLKEMPKDINMHIARINIALKKSDTELAKQYLSAAIEADPNNKELYYNLGSIYSNMKENEKAEEAFNKAIELDPNYLDAQYNLGAHLVTWAGDLKYEANQMRPGDSRYNPMIQQVEQLYTRALVPLESYITSQPKDAAVLRILYEIYYNLGNTEKSQEYKKRYEEAK